MYDWKELLALTVVGAFVVAIVMFYENRYKIKLYPGLWSFGTGMLYAIIDEAVTGFYAIP